MRSPPTPRNPQGSSITKGFVHAKAILAAVHSVSACACSKGSTAAVFLTSSFLGSLGLHRVLADALKPQLALL